MIETPIQNHEKYAKPQEKIAKIHKKIVLELKPMFLESPGQDLSNQGHSFGVGAIPGTDIFGNTQSPNFE